VKPSNALRLYRVRVRARLAQECLALVGIAAGVALLFASQVASASLKSSVTQLSHGIAGKATLQLVARDPQGLAESTLTRVRKIPGVRVAAPILEAGANAIGPGGSTPVELIGADASLSELGGALMRHLAFAPFRGIGAVVLPVPIARTIGVSAFGQEVTFQVAGRTAEAPLYALLHAAQIGALIASPLAVAPLFTVQEMTGLHARVSRILVEPTAGSGAQVRAMLDALAGEHLNVEPVDHDEKLFANAAAASNQSTLLFSVVSALVGFLFAFNAALFAVPQRRRLIVDLRRDGYASHTVIAVLLLDAVALGLLASTLGLALGYELSLHLLRPDPAFLSMAFTIGSPHVVSWQTVALAAGGGMLAAIVAVFSPLREALSHDPLAAMHPTAGSGGTRVERRQMLAGLVCLVTATSILLASPDAAIPAMVLLVGSLLLGLPTALSTTLALVRKLARTMINVVPHVATMELGAVSGRAVSIAATGAIAVFGSVAIQGAHGDLLAGLENAAAEANASADVWVSPAGSYDLLDTAPFAPVETAELERLADVRAVRLYHSGLLDYGDRRVLVIAPPPQSTPLLPDNQLVQGDAHTATERVRDGGWLVMSQAIASEHHLHIGEALTLPTANPMRLRVAALSTNLGWAPGAIIMNAADYARVWATQQVSAYEVVLAPGIAPTEGAREIRRALRAHSGLAVQTAKRRAGQQQALSREALASLSQIATLILVSAVLAMAAVTGAMIWQRRPRLAKLKLEGFPRAELWHTTLLESALLIGVGCLTGAIFGLYGQLLADHALAETVNFPVIYSVSALTTLRSLVLVITGAVAILAIPGYLAASVPAALALQD
jgi:putative ABC transport system permease protein